MKKLLNKKGFTIVELVIVIAVIAILAAVLIPTFSNVIESANKSADLSEAQNSLKAYSAYTSSKGQSLADGTVFKVKKSNRAYVFYKGSLHEIEEHDLVGSYGAVFTVGEKQYASNKMTCHYISDNDKVLEFDKNSDGKYVTFIYSDVQNVTFEDGSLNCLIYPGKVVYTANQYVVRDNDTGVYTGKMTALPEGLQEGVVNVLLDGKFDSVVQIKKKSEPDATLQIFDLKGEEAKLAVFGTGKVYNSDQVNVDGVGKLALKAGYTQGTTIVITTKNAGAGD